MEGKTLLSGQVDRWNGLEEVNVIENKSTPILILRGGLCGKPIIPNGAVLQPYVSQLEIMIFCTEVTTISPLLGSFISNLRSSISFW